MHLFSNIVGTGNGERHCVHFIYPEVRAILEFVRDSYQIYYISVRSNELPITGGVQAKSGGRIDKIYQWGVW